MIGQRSLPATVGGVERHVEEVGSRLADRGHDVTAFVRNVRDDGATEWDYRGMRLRSIGSIRTKHLEALSHSVACAWRAVREGFDVVHFHSVGPNIASPIVRLGSTARIVLTVHGLDDQRAKWNWFVRMLFRMARKLTSSAPDVVLTDAAWLTEHYASSVDVSVRHVPNGISPHLSAWRPIPSIADRRPVVLFVGRLVPEKCADLLIRAFADIPGDVELSVVGASSRSDRFARRVSSLAERDQRVSMPGAIFGRALDDRWRQATVFCLPSDVEGLPLTLLDAIVAGVPVVVSDIPAHREVLESSALGHLLFPPGDRAGLTDALARTLADPTAAAAGVARLRGRILETYDWDRTAALVEQMYLAALPVVEAGSDLLLDVG